MRERVVKSIVGQFVFQFQNAFTGAQAGFQFFRIAGLRNIVIGARLETSDDVLFGSSRRQQNNVSIWMFGMPAHLTANFDPVEPRHEPIQECQPGTICVGQTFQSLAPVLDDHNFITSVLQRFFQKASCDGVIVGNEDLRCPMLSYQPRFQLHAGLRRLSRCPPLVSEAVKTDRMSASCRDLPDDRRASRRSPGRDGTKRTPIRLSSFAKSVAISERILPVLVFNVLSPKAPERRCGSRTPACRRTTQNYMWDIQFL